MADAFCPLYTVWFHQDDDAYHRFNNKDDYSKNQRANIFCVSYNLCIRKTEIISYQSQYSHLKHDGQLPDPLRRRNLLVPPVESNNESLGARVGAL